MINSLDSSGAKLSHNEVIKEAIPTLAGTIAQTLGDAGVDRFCEDDTQFLKFHGIYQQDDRDKRKSGKYFMFMIRTRTPGGVMPASQYLVLDRLADQHGNGTLRITSRQGFQLHGVVKSSLGPTMKSMNEALVTTLAACGDVNRNVMAPSTPTTSVLTQRVYEDACRLSNALLPETRAYHQIWVEGVQLNLEDPENKEFVDPLYGKTYLPRKFKTAFAIPPLNDVDVFTNCLGFVAIEEKGELVGYNLLAGGGLGMSHGNAETYPRKADVVGFVTPDQVEAAAKGVLMVHRDFGDRTNRKHARLKYVLEERGVDWFRAELESRVGFKLGEERPFEFRKQGDLFGWHEQYDGRLFLGLNVLAGRIRDVDSYRLKSALKLIGERFQPEFRLSPSQNLILAGIKPEDRVAIDIILADHGIAVEDQGTRLERASMACPALPTCGLSLAESERFLPGLLETVEGLLKEVGLPEEEVVVRMTGCPNGCARPYMAELGFVGKAPNKYQIYLGGNESSTRLNRLFRQVVKADEIANELRPVFERFKGERLQGERFGDFCDRVILQEIAESSATAKS